jgi:hypothetical protein
MTMTMGTGAFTKLAMRKNGDEESLVTCGTVLIPYDGNSAPSSTYCPCCVFQWQASRCVCVCVCVCVVGFPAPHRS